MSPSWLWGRAAAYWLIALIIFPFSAPLSVCDLADLAPERAAATTAPLSNAPIRSSVVKDALSQAFPVRGASSRTRRDAPSERGLLLVVNVAQSTRSALRSPIQVAHLSHPITKTILRI